MSVLCEFASSAALHKILDPIISDLEDVRDTATAVAGGLEAAAVTAAFFGNAPLASAFHRQALTSFTAAAIAQYVIFEIEAFLSFVGTWTMGDFLADFFDWCVRHGHVEFLRRVYSWLFSSQAPETLTAISYAVMDWHNYLDTGCSAHGDSIELFFDASDDRLLDFIDGVLELVDRLQTGTLHPEPAKAFVGYICMRYTGGTRALIGMQQWQTTCAVEIACLKYNDVFFDAVEAKAVELGGNVHWGQRNQTTMLQVEHFYGPKLDQWRKVLSKRTDNGQHDLFSTAFSRRTGLEIVKPRLDYLVTAPMYAPTSEPVTFNWDATHNPPATTATLRSTGSAPFSPGTLSGPTFRSRIAGPAEHHLDASLTLNNRTVTTTLSTETVGFDATYASWTFLEVATCRLLGAFQRYVVDLPFAPETWSSALTVTRVRLIAVDDETWRLVCPNAPVVEFSAAAPAHSFASSLALVGPWTFVYDTPAFDGCNGPAPWLRVEVAFA
jgi:hypothetical protein